MVFGTSVLLLLIGRVSVKQIAIVCLAGGLLVAGVVFLGPRRGVYKARVNSFLHPELAHSDDTYKIDQAKIAIATWGHFDKGPGNSTLRNFRPSHYADFIYEVIIADYGMLIGGGGIIVVSI